MYKFKVLFILFILITAVSLQGKDIPEGVKISSEGNNYVINYNIPAYKMTDVKGGNEVFSLLEIPNYGIISDEGRPQLPQISFFIMTDYNESLPSFTVLNENREKIILSQKIFPKQMPWEKTRSLEDRPFIIDRAYYNTIGNSKSPFVKISEPFIMAGARGYMVTIYPFGYNPADNELYVLKNASFKIILQNQAKLNFVPSESMNNFFDDLFINYIPSSTKGTNNYLIITAPDFESGLAPLVTHKQGLGYNVTVVNTTVTGTTTTSIKAYIQNLYNNIATRPEFILLVGDVDKIPYWVGGGTGTPSTDWNYALLEGGDLWVDAFLGRFPVTNLTQLSNMITKTIYMENGVNTLWKKNVFMASTDNHTISEGTHNFVIDSFFVPNNFTVNTKLYSYYGATTAQVSQSIDSGKIFAIYSGHGSETSWADGPVFSQSNVNALNNTIFPFVYSFACVTGSYHISGECFAETWVRSPKAGVIFWGSSVNSYWDEDDILEKRFVRVMFNENLKKTAENFVRGKFLLVQYFGSMTGMMQRYIEMYNCMGDPAIYELAYGPSIAHTPLPNTENLAGPYVVNVTVSPSGSPITETKLFWTRATAFDSVSMTNTSSNNWTANIPGNGNAAIYKYFIRTQDQMGRVTYLPGGAPANYYSFTACTDTVKPVIVHSPLGNTPRNQWPVSVRATVTDNIGLDSVWVRWYKNTPSNGIKHFKLNANGNQYQALFNSVISDVQYNDSIFYRVFGRDCAIAHNTDSTSLYKFKIIAQTTAVVGTGTVSSNYPFTTYWMDGRTDMLYTAAEILAGGGGAGSISQIGFNVITADPGAMNGFNVKIQSTELTSINNFISTGWTVCYNGTYTVPGTGWQYINLTTPFVWDGTSNLLVEICYNNSAYTQYSPVNATTISNMAYGRYNDLSTGDGCTASLTSGTGLLTARPNIGFVINLVTGNEKIISNVPDKYSLEQNYPNPFNPVTKINYSLPKQNLVTLKIFDILGREVRTLVNEVKQPGVYTVEFNGSELSSGVYFYRLQSGTYTDIKRMMLIK